MQCAFRIPDNYRKSWSVSCLQMIHSSQPYMRDSDEDAAHCDSMCATMRSVREPSRSFLSLFINCIVPVLFCSRRIRSSCFVADLHLMHSLSATGQLLRLQQIPAAVDSGHTSQFCLCYSETLSVELVVWQHVVCRAELLIIHELATILRGRRIHWTLCIDSSAYPRNSHCWADFA